MSLSASSAAFYPYILLDNVVHSLLVHARDYYIKGGKAFNFYYPQEPILTTDFDIVATEEVCEYLFYYLYELLMGKMVLLGEPVQVDDISQTVRVYDDLIVRTLFLKSAKELIPIVDVIIVPRVDETEYTVDEQSGIHYMEKSAFKSDLKKTYEDRLEKSKTPSKNSKTRKKRRAKLQRSISRFKISERYGGRKR
jgi:hypothetical protein